MINLQEIKEDQYQRQTQLSIKTFDCNVKQQLFLLNQIFDQKKTKQATEIDDEKQGKRDQNMISDSEAFKAYENLSISQYRKLSKIDQNQIRMYHSKQQSGPRNTVNFLETPIYEPLQQKQHSHTTQNHQNSLLLDNTQNLLPIKLEKNSYSTSQKQISLNNTQGMGNTQHLKSYQNIQTYGLDNSDLNMVALQTLLITLQGNLNREQAVQTPESKHSSETLIKQIKPLKWQRISDQKMKKA
eukprot:403374035